MNELYLNHLFHLLESKYNITFDHGLSELEIMQIEHEYKFNFPEDLALILKQKLPISEEFPNWRDANNKKIKDMLAKPLGGICFDIEHNNFWLDTWGNKPNSLKEAFDIARYELSKAPTLIPVYSHRYIPSEPSIAGNPVYSVWQTDIIYYGYDLMDYFNREFKVPVIGLTSQSPRKINFWDEIVS